MLHTILAVLAAGYFLFIESIYFLPKVRHMHEGEMRDEYCMRLVQNAMKRVLRAAGVTFEVEGLENIPEDEKVLYVGNHRSFFDVIIGYTLLKKPTGFIAKVELTKYPFLKVWMENIHCLFLDRDNLKQNLKVIIQAIKDIRNGTCSYWIYPEGTRSKGDVKDLLPFKEGSFKIAEKTGCRIIPVAMYGTRDILEAHFPKIEPHHVKVRIGTPIDLKDLSEEDRKHIGEYTRNIMIGYLTEMENK